MKNKPFLTRFSFAKNGFIAAFQHEQSFRTQIVIAVATLALLGLLQPDLIWWAVIGVMITLVLGAELINTSLEHLADHLHPEQHPKIKIVKDCAAAAVLILSLGAVWVVILAILSVVKDSL